MSLRFKRFVSTDSNQEMQNDKRVRFHAYTGAGSQPVGASHASQDFLELVQKANGNISQCHWGIPEWCLSGLHG